MGNSSSSGDGPNVPPYKKNPRLAEELRAGVIFLQRFKRIAFQFSGELEEVWKVQDKTTKEIFSSHERQKDILNQTSGYGTNVIKENYIVQKLESPFIISLKYACQDQKTLFMITTLIHSRLSYYIKKQQDFSEEQMRYIAASIILGLEYLHSNQIMHRDLRPENIVFDAQGKVYLNGFLRAREHDSRIDNSIDNAGNIGYMAPELIEKKAHEYEVDFYSLGIILYEIATCQKLFQETQEVNYENMQCLEIKKDDLPYKCSADMINLINGLLKFNPKNRLGKRGAEEIKKHKWFAPFNWDSMMLGTYQSPIQLREEELESIGNKKSSFEHGTLKRMSTQNLYLGYQYGFASPRTRLSRKREENDIV